MKLYPTNLEEKIDFDKIKELIKEECTSTLGADFVKKVSFSRDRVLLTKLLAQTDEFRKILVSGELFPSSNFINIYPYLDKAKIAGTFLFEDEFHEIRLGLKTLEGCVAFFHRFQEEYPQLHQLLGMVEEDIPLEKSIGRVLDDKGKVKNNASQELNLIRTQLAYEESRIRKVLEQIYRSVKAQGFTPEDASVTIRAGRMVIPVLAEYKKRIKGFIHDESATGQTVYLEPAEVLDINNEIKDLEYMERREVQKILTKLTDELRGYIPALRRAFYFLGMVDFIRAKAKFALKINAVNPEMARVREMSWLKARHPLLEMALRQQRKAIVPVSLSLDPNHRLLVISGPNAGGKSVTLKTVALVQYMYQCGLLVPMEPNSSCAVFDQFFIDIGDEQNIENDLSTYSSHLMNMKHFTLHANKKTLFFIDEFGTGTEPQFGGAIAEAILTALNKSGAYGIVTTHYGNLKQLASKSQGMVNGAMRYDVDELEPLYELEIGKPGSSFAFEIAGKIGIDQEIILHAKAQVGETRVKYDKLLLKVESEKNKYESLLSEIERKDRLLNQRLQEYNSLKTTLDEQRKAILNEAKAQANVLLEEANKKIEHTIRSIKETQADKLATQRARKELDAHKTTIKPEKQQSAPPKTIRVVEGEINPGDQVRVKDNGALAEVLEIKGKQVSILIGDLKSNVKLSRLEKISNTSLKKEKKAIARRISYDTQSKMANFSPNLDIRGKRGEEVLPLIQNFIDEGYMLGMNELKIIHGKGDGILRGLTRNFISKMPSVAGFSDEHADRGGAGITLVQLKS
ncbi:DNA mismatch repair protein MutS2 [Cyclobacterium xiamenense]|uniref:Endonuclease MutS2 n=1 Tax=Cyclobacterium xiamenense TaxID=1297121 RepID=A0A1H6YI15_9BACT|nr:endonuclease MutS2 [Cyclobacterium xiamenense]SEJ36395.1 DNA mismatch repair protein MutS2 [Cyclobacterium xiamenense]